MSYSVKMLKLVCSYCGTEFIRRARRGSSPVRSIQQFCSDEHKRLGQTYTTGKAFSKSGPYSGIHTCPGCRQDFSAHHPNVVYCSDRCRYDARNKRLAARYADVAVDGLTADQRKLYKHAKLIDQKNCMICRESFEKFDLRQIHVDHAHDTGKLRDLLCFKCNAGLGQFGESIENLEAAVEYLKRWRDNENRNL